MTWRLCNLASLTRQRVGHVMSMAMRKAFITPMEGFPGT
jgi:hypothetical protein